MTLQMTGYSFQKILVRTLFLAIAIIGLIFLVGQIKGRWENPVQTIKEKFIQVVNKPSNILEYKTYTDGIYKNGPPNWSSRPKVLSDRGGLHPALSVPKKYPQEWDMPDGTHKETMVALRSWRQAEAVYNVTMAELEYFCVKLFPIASKTKYNGKDVYYLCDDEPFQIPKATQSKPCLVYSFGIANDFSFDDDIANLKGCEVHAFDPSMKQKSHKRSDKVWFYNIGLGSKDEDNFSPLPDGYTKQGDKWKMRTLSSLMKELGHEGRNLDVLKIDIEGYEFEGVLEQIITSGIMPRIRQFAIEQHVYDEAKYKYVSIMETMNKIHDLGFRRFSIVGIFHHCRAWYCNQHHISYINANFKG